VADNAAYGATYGSGPDCSSIEEEVEVVSADFSDATFEDIGALVVIGVTHSFVEVDCVISFLDAGIEFLDLDGVLLVAGDGDVGGGGGPPLFCTDKACVRGGTGGELISLSGEGDANVLAVLGA
jgi:hypothetical protein